MFVMGVFLIISKTSKGSLEEFRPGHQYLPMCLHGMDITKITLSRPTSGKGTY